METKVIEPLPDKQLAREDHTPKRDHKNKTYIRTFLTGLCWGLTPYIFNVADNQRGYDSTGGEILFPFIPLLIWIVASVFKDFVKSSTEANENTNIEKEAKK